MTDTDNPSLLDLSRYLRPLRLGASDGILLVARLLRVAPEVPSPRVLTSLAEVRSAGEAVQAIVRERHRLRTHNLRPYDSAFDNAFAAGHARLQAHARVSSNPRREDAAKLLATLYPDNLSFLTHSYEQEWVYGQTLLERIEVEGHGPLLDELIGPEFVAFMRESHAQLGEALGVGTQTPESAPPLMPALARLSRAIANYARLYVGELELDVPKQVATFMQAMAPIDAHRARRSGTKGASAEGEAEPEPEPEPEPTIDELVEPLPELPEPEPLPEAS